MPESQPLPDVRYTPARPRAELIAAIRDGSASLDPSLRILAENILGAGSQIDLVAADAEGRVVLVMLGEEGEDRDLFTRALAQRAWVAPRVRDWIQLAPSLGLRPDSSVTASILCPSYSPETVVAADAVGAQILQLSTYRWVQSGAATHVLIEPSPRAQGADQPVTRRVSGTSTGHSTAAEDGAGPGAPFRTGLTEEDLNLTPQEVRDFD
jgi:hypothetical protein